MTAVRRDVAVVLAVQAVAAALVAGWFATGHASAPDDGMLQLDVLSLSERVPGLTAVGGRPTMVVGTAPRPRAVQQLSRGARQAKPTPAATPATTAVLDLPGDFAGDSRRIRTYAPQHTGEEVVRTL